MHLLISVFLAFEVATASVLFTPQVANCTAVAGCDCSATSAGEFSLCAEDSSSTTDGGSTSPNQPAMRECRYFANGTIDSPTMTVITAWVPVGSRLCIGDVIPEPSDSSSSWQRKQEIELREKLTAFASRPVAWWSPGGELEYQDPLQLQVQANNELVEGLLLGKAAQIRFRPVSARWELSDGQVLYGFSKSHSFASIGTFSAVAHVRYEVDYKYQSANWVFAAASWELPSNKLLIFVIERPRRTLLVG